MDYNKNFLRSSVDSMAESDSEDRVFTQFVSASKRIREKPAKFVVFNIGSTTATEFRDILTSCLGPAWGAALLRISRIANGRTPPRLLIDVRSDLAGVLKVNVRETFRQGNPRLRTSLKGCFVSNWKKKLMPGKWRLAEWRPFCHRITRPVKPVPQYTSIMTWNVNGFDSKKFMIEKVAHDEKVGILLLQETLHNSACSPLCLQDYNTFSIERVAGFRGQAILVHTNIRAYQIMHEEKFLLHVKISKWNNDACNMHVLSIYLPSGGNRRGARTACYAKLTQLSQDISAKDKDAVILLAGDFNEDEIRIQKRLENHKDICYIPTNGAPSSRFPRAGKAKALDHFVGSKSFLQIFQKPRVLRQHAISDHRPVVVRAKKYSHFKPPPVIRTVFDSKVIKSSQVKIASSNRWRVFGGESGMVDDMVTVFNGISDDLLRSIGAKRDIEVQRSLPKMPRRIVKLLRRYQEASQSYADAVDHGRLTENIKEKVAQTKAAFRRSKLDWENSRRLKGYVRLGEDMLSNDFKSAWTRVSHLVHQDLDKTMLPLTADQPLRDRNGILTRDPLKVQEIMKDHYRSLHQDDPLRVCKSEAWWNTMLPFLDEAEGDQRAPSEDLSWLEVLGAIRSMNRDTAPGKDGLHINMFKAMVREESMENLKVKLPGRTRWENIQVDLSLKEMLPYPLTKMGKAVWMILRKVWQTEEIPSAWDENIIISLYKGGSPEDPKNYRGITLISVFQKVLMTVLVKRLHNHMDGKGLYDENQGGFRPGEEAISQFIALEPRIEHPEIERVVP